MQAQPHAHPSPLQEEALEGRSLQWQEAGWHCVERSQVLLTAVGFPLPHGLVLEPLLLFSEFLFSHPPGSGSVILGKRLVVPGPLGVLLPKQTSLKPLGSSWIPEGEESPETVPQTVHVCAYVHFPGERGPWTSPASYREGSEAVLGVELPSARAASPLSLVPKLLLLLPPCSPWGQEPRVPGPQTPLEGSQWFLSPGPLGGAPVPQSAPCRRTSVRATLHPPLL